MKDIYTFRHAVREFLTYPTSSDGRQSDDNGWSMQSLTNKLIDHRAMVVSAVKMENDGLSEAMTQILQCVPMKEIDRVECPCAPPNGCYWARSVTPIPTPIVLKYVSDVEGNDMFTKTTWQDVHRLVYSRIKSKLKRRHYLMREDGLGQTHLYVLLPTPVAGGPVHIPAFTLAGVFMNPIEVAQYPLCDGSQSKAVCAPLDVPFFTDRTLRTMIFSSLANEILGQRGQAPTDTLNNDTNDSKEQRKQAQ